MQIEQNIAGYTIAPFVERVAAGAGAAVLAGGSAVVAAFDPSNLSIPACPLYSITGLACPGCGLTRGFHALFHGDVVTGLDLNALIPVWATIFAWVLVSLLLLAIRGKGLKMWPTAPRFLWSFMVVLAVFGVIRNLPFYPFSILYP